MLNAVNLTFSFSCLCGFSLGSPVSFDCAKTYREVNVCVHDGLGEFSQRSWDWIKIYINANQDKVLPEDNKCVTF